MPFQAFIDLFYAMAIIEEGEYPGSVLMPFRHSLIHTDQRGRTKQQGLLGYKS